ncbi:hypothetical protein F5Y19DRAFT_446584 [Xylariaceae sp. FL1651]|nr:hypothetical protein F5Y19DRAFT_446584 [Xylariaceae sp. FL1651]
MFTEGGILVVAYLPMKDIAARNEQIRRLTIASEYGFENDPDTAKYTIMVPRDETDQTSVWVFEEYASQAALDVHTEWPPVKDIIAFMMSENPLAGAPIVHELPVTDLSFAREEVTQYGDPYIAVTEIEYHLSIIPNVMPYWKEVVEASRKETGTLVYGVYPHPTDPNKLFTIEVYKSKDYLCDVHAKSEAVVENIKDTKDMRKGLKPIFLKKVSGYLYRPSS